MRTDIYLMSAGAAVLLFAISTVPARADMIMPMPPAPGEPWAGEVNGVSYNWTYDAAGPTTGGFSFLFSAPVSVYELDIDFPYYATGPHVAVSTQNQPNIFWQGNLATIDGNLGGSAGLNIAISVASTGIWNPPLGQPMFWFSNLVDPPAASGGAGIQQTPEPAPFLLTGSTLLAFVLFRLWSSRNSTRAGNRPRVLEEPV